MDDARTQLVDKLKTANNILVTVSRNPSVDQLSALLGLTLTLNKQGKHAAAVFSGEVPSTLEFLQPEETIEKNTDSLRDFIIALDKNKADKLRYKIEDNVVRIFITPYKTSISQDDFDFSQGDFNVDLVVALGVHQQEDLDEAITAHGRILHDATVASINIAPDGGLGVINWHHQGASSLSELVTTLAQSLGENLLDEQIATALLTGIVAETDRFRNAKTRADTMSASAALMAAGANQQLVAEKLEQPAASDSIDLQKDESEGQGEDEAAPNDGSMDIDHETEAEPSIELPTPEENSQPDPAGPSPEPEITEGNPEEITPAVTEGSKLVTEPPTMGGVLTANSMQEQLDPVTDPLSMPKEEDPQLLDRSQSVPQFTPPPASWEPPAPPAPMPEPPAAPAPMPEPPAAPDFEPPEVPEPSVDPNQTLTEIEQSVDSPHADVSADLAGLDTARDEVNRALTGSTPVAPQPIQALNAQPLGTDLHPAEPVNPVNPVPAQDFPAPAQDFPAPAQDAQVNDPTAPPPVPPPIPFQFGNQPPQQ